MKYFVYILKSKKDSSFYIGYTSNLERRLSEHNEGRSRYTAKKAPWELHYFEEFLSKSEAIKRERFLKKQKNSTFYSKLENKDKLVW
ncbi:MAG: GIY-YIG nuclease family protein [Bacteroidales bacterium]|nr:GIY-YIG nuclease family protein [Bacteroidales bacterium]